MPFIAATRASSTTANVCPVFRRGPRPSTPAVDAVHVWHYPALAYSSGVVTAAAFDHDDYVLAATTQLDSAVADVLDGSPVAEGATLERAVVEGPVAERLLERSDGADLLAVGHRGRGGFSGLLLGSVANQCSAHARCPVVIVRP